MIPGTVSAPPTVTAEQIGRLRLFSALSDAEKHALATMATIVDLPAGAVLFHEKEDPDALYIVIEGRITLCTPLPARSEACFLTLTEGELLGWSALLRRPRVASARAAETTRLLRFPASDLLTLCEQDHHVGYVVMTKAFEEVADRLQQTRLQLLDMFDNPGG